ncbi:MAG: hypothetical protein DWQ06_14020 [Calditrichaeota bacterium]|nr:MAG: hypothetical protein DWQ06_14020 [Calditrichota bacterium]
MKFNYKYILPISLIALAGCSLDDATFEAEEPTQATKDLFANYVSIGNSLTAGFTNSGLRHDYQENCFPAQIARGAGKIATDNGATTSADEFEIPYINFPGISTLGGNTGTTVLVGFTATGSPNIQPGGTYTDPELPGMLNNVALTRPYNNLGVPGAVAAQIPLVKFSSDSLAGENPFFDLVLRNNPADTTAKTILEQAIGLNPSFVSVWLGNNEVLGYATAGGLNDLDETIAGFNPFNKTLFEQSYTAIWGALLQANPDLKGFTCTVPKITNAPFFTTVKPYYTTAENSAIPEGVHVPVWGKKLLDGTVRMLTEDEFVLLTAASVMATGAGSDSSLALDDQYWLDSDEIAIIEDYVTAYNATINTVASANGIPVFDTNTFLEEFLPENGGKGVLSGIDPLTTEFISGGIFGLDGVHPNPLGYGLLANELMDMINEKYGTNLQHVNLNKLVGIVE